MRGTIFNMIERYSTKSLTWVDVLSPTEDEVRELFEEYKPPLEFLSDLTTPVARSEAFCTGGALKATLHFPIVKRTDITHPHEVDFIVLKNTLITVRYEDIEAMQQFQKEFEVTTALHKTKKGANGAHLFFALLRTLYASLDTKLDYLESKMDSLSQEMVEGQEKQMVFTISDISRKLIAFRHTMKTHDEILESMDEHVDQCFGKGLADEMVSIVEQYDYLVRRISILFETLEELRDTNFAILTTKQNETMKILTIMAFITFPLSLFTSMFGMNTVNTPILGMPGDFWIIVMIMSAITVSFFAFFKYKHWM